MVASPPNTPPPASTTKPILVQFGCGDAAPVGWRNFDASPTLIWERLPLLNRIYKKNAEAFPSNVEFGDIVKGLPLPANHCDAVYSSHVLEHMSLTNFRLALANTFKILKPGGCFRAVVPDLHEMAQNYVDSQAPEAAETFVKQLQMGIETEPKGFFGRLVHTFGYTRHLWMWDVKALQRELAAAGFVNVRAAAMGDSALAAFAQVEDPDRWQGGAGVEAFKPVSDQQQH